MQVPQTPQPADLPKLAATILGRVRGQGPRVHCITNAVAQNFTANMLLAAGAVPSMTITPDEVGQFVARCDALLINLGTFDEERRVATDIAIEAAAQDDLPWVLDPVFIDRSPARAEFARELVQRRPDTVRPNHAEFSALSGVGVSHDALMQYARTQDVVLALSGETDLVADATHIAAISNGDPLMARVTAMGCAGSALVAACLAVEADPWSASACALLMLGIAGEQAAQDSKGPGSFAVAIVDALANLDGKVIVERARVT
ncbi:MAG TPA: hydroxyethylthiazole kinase [Pseudolabrys sp.]|nr:hydroxyethylthiazole kinase [Pseudolabrys sp.]